MYRTCSFQYFTFSVLGCLKLPLLKTKILKAFVFSSTYAIYVYIYVLFSIITLTDYE
jgi:hypothetical protein